MVGSVNGVRILGIALCAAVGLMPMAASAQAPAAHFTATFTGVTCDQPTGTSYSFVITNTTPRWADFDVFWLAGNKPVNFPLSQPSGPANYTFVTNGTSTLVLRDGHMRFLRIRMTDTCS